jgi:hypothetical protein
MTIPIPAGLELPDVPEGETISLPVTFTVGPEGLTPIDIDGFAVSESEEEMPESESGETDEDFISAVNRQLK